jgi:DNA-binding MarR family transcriptional regulator/GNAT superfamily N-acetyltransferase
MISSLQPDPDPAVSAVRRFNRFYTRLVGVLDEQYMQTGFSLAEARVLFELATRSSSSAKEISDELALDPGYLSRILRKFADSGLLARTPLATDARQTTLRLTRKGKSAFAALDRRPAEYTRQQLQLLTPAQRTALANSMQTIEAILAPAGTQPPFILRPHRAGDMGWIVSRQAALYATEYGWNTDYEALAARIAADFLQNFDPARERCWIAERSGEPLGAIFLVRHPEFEGAAKLRLLHVERAARGLGLGRALVTECVSFARSAGYRRITLWTQSILTAAQHLYSQAGFRLVAEEPHQSFGHNLTGQTWELDLNP